MRNRRAFFSCTSAVVGALLAAGVAMAHDDHHDDLPRSCTGGGWVITVVAGPCAVSNPSSPACAASGAWTGIEYEITGAADHVATLVTSNNNVSVATGNQVYAACAGDPMTGLGKYSCHEKAVKVNPDSYTHRFWVVVDGSKAPVETSIVAKKGRSSKSFLIEGLGLPINPFQALQKTETIVFKGCAVTFVFDALTGGVLSATNDPDKSDPTATCSDVIVSTVDKLSLTLDVPGVGPLGLGKFGDGYISTGENSCTTRVVGGKVYTWGSPCT